MTSYVSIARPDHWFKNVFMLFGMLLAYLYHPELLGEFEFGILIWAVASTCLVASSNYVINEILDAVDAKDPGDKLDVQQGRGVNLVAVGRANGWLAELLLEEARLAASGGNTVLARTKTEQADKASERAGKARRQAKTNLLEVVVKDGSRDRAGRALVRLCIEAGDEESLAAAKKSIMALDDPPPAA